MASTTKPMSARDWAVPGISLPYCPGGSRYALCLAAHGGVEQATQFNALMPAAGLAVYVYAAFEYVRQFFRRQLDSTDVLAGEDLGPGRPVLRAVTRSRDLPRRR